MNVTTSPTRGPCCWTHLRCVWYCNHVGHNPWTSVNEGQIWSDGTEIRLSSLIIRIECLRICGSVSVFFTLLLSNCNLISQLLFSVAIQLSFLMRFGQNFYKIWIHILHADGLYILHLQYMIARVQTNLHSLIFCLCQLRHARYRGVVRDSPCNYKVRFVYWISYLPTYCSNHVSFTRQPHCYPCRLTRIPCCHKSLQAVHW